MKQITTILLLLISLSGIGQVSPPASHTIKVKGSGGSGTTDTALIKSLISDSTKRFGIEDNLGLQDRLMDLNGHGLRINLESSGFNKFHLSNNSLQMIFQGLGTNDFIDSYKDKDGYYLTTNTDILHNDISVDPMGYTISSREQAGNISTGIRRQLRLKPNSLTIRKEGAGYSGIDREAVTSVKVNGTEVFADSTGLVDLGTISGGGTTKYSTTEYGMLTDSGTANLYKFRADTTVLESQARAVNRAALKLSITDTAVMLSPKWGIESTTMMPSRKGYRIYPQYKTYHEEPLEFVNIGSNFNVTDSSHWVPTSYSKYNWALVSTWNMRFDTVSQQWRNSVLSMPTNATELGKEGVTLHTIPAGGVWDATWHEQLQVRPAGVDGTTGLITGVFIQAKAPIYMKYKSGTYSGDSHPWTGGTTEEYKPLIWLNSDEMKGNSTNEFIRIETNYSTPATGGRFFFRRSGGSYAAKTAVATNSIAGVIDFSQYDGARYQNTAQIMSFADATATSGVAPQSIALRTSATDSTANAVRLRVWGDGRISIGTQTPNSTLDINGSVSKALSQKTANYTLTATDNTIECTANTFNLTLPTSVGILGREYWVTNTGSGTITMLTTSSQTFINVTTTPTTLSIPQFTNYKFVSNGTNWLAYKIVN